MSLTRTIQPERGFVIFERVPYWGPELKRQFSDQNLLVRECRSIGDVSRSVADFRQCVVVLCLDSASTDCLTWIGEQSQLTQAPPIVVIASALYFELEWTLREAGVAAYVKDEICGRDLARICARLIRAVRCPPVAAPFEG